MYGIAYPQPVMPYVPPGLSYGGWYAQPAFGTPFSGALPGLALAPQMAYSPHAGGYRRRRRPLAHALHQARELGLYGRARTAERALAAGTVLGATGATLGAVGMSMLGMGAIGAVLGAGAGAAAAMLGARALAS